MEKLRKFIAGLSVTALLASVIGFGAIASAATFTDVDSDHWAYSSVEDLASQGVVEGFSDGSFGCAATANRAEFSKMVALAFGFDASTDYDAGFSDVSSDAWYAGYVNVLAQNGVVGGYTDADGDATGLFGPGDTVTRAAAAKMLVAAAGLETMSGGNYFSDVSSGAWYYDAVETLYANSVVDGYGDGRFGPGDDLQRCALAKMVVGAQNPVLRDMGDDDVTGDDDEVVDPEEEVVVSTGALSVAMGDTVTGAAVPKGATGVEMLNVEVSAASDAVRLNELVFHRHGVGASTDFSNVYLYEGADRLTTGRTISSETNNVTFSGLRLDLDAGETRTLTVVGDFATGASASNTDGFELLSADGVSHNGASTGGTFPLVGPAFSVSGASAGSVTITKQGSLSNVTVGDEGAQVAKFRLSASGEDVWLHNVALRLRGSVSSSLVSNFTLWQGTTELATVDALNSQDLMVFVLADPLEIDNGSDTNFTVTADIGAADANDTILIDLDEDTDLVAVGAVYGYGAQVDSDDSNGYDGNTTSAVTSSCSGWTDASCVTVEGGQFTISFNGPSTSDIPTNGNDVVFGRYTLTSEVDVEVRQLQVTFAMTTVDAAGGLYNTTASTPNFTNIKLVDEDTGDVLGSPQDLDSSSDTSQTLDYTDIFYIDAGESRNLKVTADVANNSSLDGQIITATLEEISTSEGVRDLSTGEYVTDIVPASAVAGNPMTVQTPTLSVALASPSTSDTIVKGTNDFDAGFFAFTAGDASDITVTDMTVSCYFDEDADSTAAKGSENSQLCSDVVTSITLFDGDGAQVSTSSKTFSSAGEATFTGMTWTIPAGQTERLVPVVNIGRSGVPTAGTSDIFAIDFTTLSTDVTAQDVDGNSVTLSGTTPNGGTTPTREITVQTAGLITVAASNDPIRDDKVLANDNSANPTLVSRFKIYGQDEDFQVTELAFENDATGATLLENDGAVMSVYLQYPTSLSAPDVLDGSASTILNSSGQALFTGLDMMVPESETSENAVNVEVYVTTNAVGQGSVSGDLVVMDFNEGLGFKAVGQGSGTTVTHGSAATLFGTTSDIAGNAIAIYKSLPTFAKDTSSTAPCPASGLVAGSDSAVYCFSVTASSGGDVALYQLTFDATQNLLNTGTLGGTAGFTLFKYESDGGIIQSSLGSGTWASNQVAISFTSEELVSKSATNYYVLKAPVTYTDSTDTSSLSVRLAAETVTEHTANVAAAAAAAAGLQAWSDISATTHSVTSTDWTNAYKLENLPSGYLQLSES
jgi:hypothetical protein